MSSTPRATKQKSILSFFNRTPKSEKKEKPKPSLPEPDKENATKKVKTECITPVRAIGTKLKRVRVESDASDENDDKPVKRARTKQIIESDDDESPIRRKKPQQKKKKVDDDSDFEASMETEETQSDGDQSMEEDEPDIESEEEEPSPQKKTKKKPIKTIASKQPKAAANRTLDMSSFMADDDEEMAGALWDHEKHEWLKPNKLTDLNKNKPTEPEYDPTTLYVPPDYIKKLTPGMGNWWKIKSRNYDTVIFYKVGKFYELYHMDAVIGVNVCGLTFMKGNFAHCGFPEMRFENFAAMMLDNGIKVARVEQTETQEQNKERVKQSKDWSGKKKALDKFEKQTRRELCRVETPGTRMADFSPNGMAPEEKLLGGVYEDGSTIGFCLIDASQGMITLGQFEDDLYFKNFRTLLAHRNVRELIVPTQLSESLKEIIKNSFDGDSTVQYVPSSKFMPLDKVDKTIRELETDDIKLELLLNLVRQNEVAARAVGGVFTQLKRYQLIHEVIRTAKAEVYVPPSADNVKRDVGQNRRMILDSMTLTNLDVISSSESQYGSVLKKLNTCSSAGGKRAMRRLVTNPYSHMGTIQNEQNIIKLIMDDDTFQTATRELLSKMPDLERLISKFGTLSHGIRPDDHPDSRAIMYEEILYSKQKTAKFCYVLESFNSVAKWLNGLEKAGVNSQLISDVRANMPDFDQLLAEWRTNFDAKKAKENGTLVPKAGTNTPYDEAVAMIDQTKEEAEQFRAQAERDYGSAKMMKSGKMHFVVQIKDTKKVPSNWTAIGSRKGFKNYTTPDLKVFNETMERYMKQKDFALKASSSIVFQRFFADAPKWRHVVNVINRLDVRLALVKYSASLEVSTFPEFVDDQDGAVLEIEQGRHPTVDIVDFIPNDTSLSNQKCLLLTGPNMGGKSTIIRQVGLLSLLAHYGCAVPAESMRLSVIDRIFTRLGASDRLLKGESTFMVEMTETAAILNSGTSQSLMLLDELGRGTSTSDGQAIAGAVLEEISTRQVRSVFSTHYHKLARSALPKGCSSMHMACHVANDENGQENVTFLYTLTSGAAEKSHGFNAARLAAIPENVVKNGEETAENLETLHKGIAFLCALQNERMEDALELVK